MATALILRHVAFEDLGSFAAPLARAGYDVCYHEAGQRPLDLDAAAAADLLIILGGPVGVYEREDYPWLDDEIAATRRRLDADAPTLGICLGSQIMAAALGARVYPGREGKEIGWDRLTISAAGLASPIGLLADVEVLHWHGDTFDLPINATLLASTARYAHQAFGVGRRGLALQFHPEVEVSGLESWLIGHTGEIDATPGVSVGSLRSDNSRYAARLANISQSFLSRWLDDIAR